VTDPLISIEQLVRLGDSAAIADVRWYLDEPDRGRAEYRSSHIPGAVYVDLDSHLSASDGPGRHPLPTRQEFALHMSELGFGNDDLIVAYDDRGGAIAARLWWMLRDIGHEHVRVLDGGITSWLATGRPSATGIETRPPAQTTPRPGSTRQLDKRELEARLGSVRLLDARAPERYRGDEEPIDPVAGHIPTAIHADMTANLLADGTFRDAEDLRSRFEALGVSSTDETVVYCGSGVTACHNALGLVRAGYPEPILYPGSWSDWSSSGGAVATGDEPGPPPAD
jgi:thiosulfate/3-mercaptopyruvate sulfurtransferase